MKTIFVCFACIYNENNDFIQQFLLFRSVSATIHHDRQKRKLLYFIKNIFICVLKMNEGLTGLERHEGE